MVLEDIGFYTLSDERAKSASASSPLQRCELILTDRCNFKCPYCRGVREDCKGTLSQKEIGQVLGKWISNGLRNVRFSGGEPTLHPLMIDAVRVCRVLGVDRIAVSTNGSAPISTYKELIDAGVNDFSVSLDACCAAFGEKMAGVDGKWDHVLESIAYMIGREVYTTVGIVANEENIDQVSGTISLADDLGVSDIRVISAAQSTELRDELQQQFLKVPIRTITTHPILKYRVENANDSRGMRGLSDNDSNRCGLVLDDMAVAGGYHFPCIIYLREGGEPIGKITDESFRQDREMWANEHDTHNDPICKKNCLDVCADYNNKYREFHS